jgi:hypothetical protein
MMSDEEFAIAMPGALLKLDRMRGMFAAHVDLQLLKLKPLRLTRILDGFLNLADQS